jgi:septum formation protein
MSKIMMFSSPTQLVLASGSSYRKALLDRLGLQFTVSAADIDESPLPGEAPCALAERLAIEKARAVAPRFPGHLIVGSDQVATLDGVTTLGKPMSHVRAVEQLTALSGKEAYFHTAVCLLNATTGVLRCTLVTTTVEFRTLSPAAIETYQRRDRPYDCTGSAKIEAFGIVLVRRVSSDDPSALIGLPLIALQDQLAAEGIALV